MQSKVFSVQGKEIKTIELSDAVFGLPVNEDVIWYAINNELANKRVGTADTKTRKDVHGSNRRPYSQKGTGRARQGDVKSPLYVGGGIVFGPHPRDYSYSMPKKAKRLAMKSILSMKAQNSTIKVVEDFSVDSGKTKDLVAVLKNLLPQDKAERTVIVLKDDDSMVKRAGKNIPWLHFLSYNRLRAHDLFYGRTVLVMESAVNSLNEFYAE
ncbi:MAG: 50S ribosomal protein L4 [Spirochaetes bacterium]|nr:50S ribosomal protein L4 [Spirochaetota bacterium]MBU0955991.1 50S ribosomal protein L4 [Spirochaetota bacterium]